MYSTTRHRTQNADAGIADDLKKRVKTTRWRRGRWSWLLPFFLEKNYFIFVLCTLFLCEICLFLFL